MYTTTTTHAAVCDRCGYAETTTDLGGSLSMWDRVTVQPMVEGMDMPTLVYDLCPSCAQEASVWFYKAPPKEEDDGLAEWERELLRAQEEEPTGWSDEPCHSCADGEHGDTDTDGVEVWCICCNAVIAP